MSLGDLFLGFLNVYFKIVLSSDTKLILLFI